MILQPPIGWVTFPAITLTKLWSRVRRAVVTGWGWLRYCLWYRWQARQVLRMYEEQARRRDLRRRSHLSGRKRA